MRQLVCNNAAQLLGRPRRPMRRQVQPRLYNPHQKRRTQTGFGINLHIPRLVQRSHLPRQINRHGQTQRVVKRRILPQRHTRPYQNRNTPQAKQIKHQGKRCNLHGRNSLISSNHIGINRSNRHANRHIAGYRQKLGQRNGVKRRYKHLCQCQQIQDIPQPRIQRHPAIHGPHQQNEQRHLSKMHRIERPPRLGQTDQRIHYAPPFSFASISACNSSSSFCESSPESTR